MWDALREEFSDISDLSAATRVCIRLLVAAILGGILGYERERRGKSAGLRTHILVALGSCVFVMTPKEMGIPDADMTRVLQGLLAGIGFLGAGAIVKHTGGGGSSVGSDDVRTPDGTDAKISGGTDDASVDAESSKAGKKTSVSESDVRGLTTAAGIWMTAAIGMSAGLGRELTAIVSTLFALVVLALLPRSREHHA